MDHLQETMDNLIVAKDSLSNFLHQTDAKMFCTVGDELNETLEHLRQTISHVRRLQVLAQREVTA